jgi:CheY-like chemotaxis protein
VANLNLAVLFVFRETLSALGKTNEIVTAQNGLEGLNEFNKKPFALIVTNLKMPDFLPPGSIDIQSAACYTHIV